MSKHSHTDKASLLLTLIRDLYPICRSITGNGVRETLDYLRQHLDLKICEVPTGTQAFDWEIPKEWNIKDAWIKKARGEKIVDFQESNLHVVSYSVPFQGRMTGAELKQHLHSLPEHPDWIPYRTSYYHETWGFCLEHRRWLEVKDDETYEVCIDATLESGHLTYGELFVPGRTEDEVLISCHCCHPSLANDNLSGIAVATELARHIQSRESRYSYRFLFIPGTIGSITWLALHDYPTPSPTRPSRERETMSASIESLPAYSPLGKIKHGLVLSCLGDPGKFHYKRSRRGNAEIDRMVAQVFQESGQEHAIMDFVPYGYDERQYCSPGINLPVGCFMRTPSGRYPEYHTSADNLDLIDEESLTGSLHMLIRVVEGLEANARYINLQPKGEPQLGRRGLYRQMGGLKDVEDIQQAMLWVLNYSDGHDDLLDIAEKSGLSLKALTTVAEILVSRDLLIRV